MRRVSAYWLVLPVVFLGCVLETRPASAFDDQKDKFQRAAELEALGSRILAQLQSFTACRSDSYRLFSEVHDWLGRAAQHRGAPGLRQMSAAVSAEDQRVYRLPVCQKDTTTISIDGHSTSMRTPTVNGGTQIVGGQEIPITNIRRNSGYGAAFEISRSLRPVFGTDPQLFVRGAFDLTRGSSSDATAPGATVAQAYIIQNPFSGSRGIAAGATGQSVNIAAKADVYDVVVGARTDLAGLGSQRTLVLISGGRISTDAGIGVHYRRLQVGHTIDQQSLTFAGLNSHIDLSTNANFVGPDFSLGIGSIPTEPSGLFFNFRTMVAPGVLWTSGTASQTSNCAPCGGGSPEFNVNLRRDFSDSKFSVIAGVRGEIGYQLNSFAKISLNGSYEYMSQTPSYEVPITPAQQPIKLAYDSSQIWRVGAKLTIPFGVTPPPP